MNLLFRALLALVATCCAYGAQEPKDVRVPDTLKEIVISPIVFENGVAKSFLVKAVFNETLIDAKGVLPTITRVKGSVQFDLVTDAAQTVSVVAINPATGLAEETHFICAEVVMLLKAIAEKNWAQVMPPPLPQTRRSMRSAPPVAMTVKP